MPFSYRATLESPSLLGCRDAIRRAGFTVLKCFYVGPTRKAYMIVTEVQIPDALRESLFLEVTS